MKLVMVGAPLSGKGSISELINKDYNLVHISTGDIFRELITKDTPLALKVREYMDKAVLVPDEITINMLKSRLNEDDVKNGMILDGFPRTIAQAKSLDTILEEKNMKIDMVLNLSTPKEEIIERVITRRVCSNPECKTIYNIKLNPPKIENICDKCGSKLVTRKDDTLEAIETRLENYFNLTNPLVEFYKNKGCLTTEEVSEKINRMGKDVADDIAKRF